MDVSECCTQTGKQSQVVSRINTRLPGVIPFHDDLLLVSRNVFFSLQCRASKLLALFFHVIRDPQCI